METPQLQIESTGAVFWLGSEVTTIGRGAHTDIRLDHPSVSKLHAEIIRRGPYAYVSDLALSLHGTRVNGRVVAQRLLENEDVISFGAERCRISGLPVEEALPESDPRRVSTPELTRRELDVVAALCKSALSMDAFVAPATARDIAADLVVTEAAVKQHLLRLYQKLRIAAGPDRRVRLANEVMARGLVRLIPAGTSAAVGARAGAAGRPARTLSPLPSASAVAASSAVRAGGAGETAAAVQLAG